MPLNLKDKNILVTGGSRGIGSSIVRRLSQLGARIGFTYSRRPELASAVLSGLDGHDHFFFELNLASTDSIDRGFSHFLEKTGSIDGLVNNAGITKDQLILRMKGEDFDEVIQTNLRGSFLCSKLAAKAMLKNRRGSLVHITSVIGQTGNPGQVSYAAAKAGVEAMSKSIAQELASRGIRSNCVAPGFIQSDMTDSLNDTQKSEILRKIPLGSIGTGEDVANAVAFLLCDDSKYITGHTLNVNGGMFMN